MTSRSTTSFSELATTGTRNLLQEEEKAQVELYSTQRYYKMHGRSLMLSLCLMLLVSTTMLVLVYLLVDIALSELLAGALRTAIQSLHLSGIVADVFALLGAAVMSCATVIPSVLCCISCTYFRTRRFRIDRSVAGK